jgi:3-oxoacyl-[acyl-carrier protein] reductase
VTFYLRPIDGAALVTGAASGIGFATAKALARLGHPMLIWDRQFDEPEETMFALGECGAPSVILRVVDVTSTEAVARNIAEYEEKQGPIGVLVNNAGISRDGMSWKATDDDWADTLSVNLLGAQRTIRELAGRMRARTSGRIVNVASILGLHGRAGTSAYAASKGGLIALTRAVAAELAPSGVTCNAVAPGFVQSPMTDAMPPEARKAAFASIPMGEPMEPDDVAGAVAYFASTAARHITGTVLEVAGGLWA